MAPKVGVHRFRLQKEMTRNESVTGNFTKQNNTYSLFEEQLSITRGMRF
jgi:hypothetical protein